MTDHLDLEAIRDRMERRTVTCGCSAVRGKLDDAREDFSALIAEVEWLRAGYGEILAGQGYESRSPRVIARERLGIAQLESTEREAHD